MDPEYLSIEGLDLTSEQRKAVEFLAEFSRQMVLSTFTGEQVPTSALTLIKEIYRFADEMITGCLKSGTELPCKEGCVWCCFLRVKVTPLEVMGIIDYLRSRLEPAELSALRKRLAEADEITRGIDGHRRIGSKLICPLIQDKKCLVYPVRPITCRIYHSINSSDCESSLDDDRQIIKIRVDISVIGMGLSAGLTTGLHNVGMRTNSLELIAGLRIALDDPGLMRRWLAGDPAFSEAEIESTI
jgi:Fe-S-cluster containining protein